MSKRPVIIDCDPGHDDAVAILLALASEELDVKGITIVGGNQTLEKCLDNTLKFLSHLDIDVPVAAGAAGPILRDLEVAPYAHGDSGMDGPQLSPATMKAVDKSAVELMAEVLTDSSEPVTIVGIGPLTNVATFLLSYPHLKSKIKEISIMGGACHIGNKTPAAEFNIWEDPDAADIVFKSGIPLVMSGLDVTLKAYIDYDFKEQARALKTKAGVFVAELLDFFEVFNKKLSRPGCAMHDSCAVAYLINPEIFSGKDYFVEIDLDGELTQGATVVHGHFLAGDKNPNCKVLLDVDRLAFQNLLMDSVKKIGDGGKM